MLRSLSSSLSAFCLSVFLLGCPQGIWKTNEPTTAEYDETLEKTFEYCERYFLPNTAVRGKDSDINQVLRKIDEERKLITSIYHSPTGVTYLERRLIEDTDEIHRVCMLLVLSESKQPGAYSIVKHYSNDIGVVGERARDYLPGMNR